MMKELTESWKYGLYIDDDINSNSYGCIIKLVRFDKEREA